MNEREKVVLEEDLEFGEITLFEEKPFCGFCVKYHENGKKEFEKHYKDGQVVENIKCLVASF